MAKLLKINNARIIAQMSKATIKTLVDGIVELVTNSDDSYRKLEASGRGCSGKIEIAVDRKKGGICTKLIVKDRASGMTNEELEEALTFGGETSGFLSGKSVRGFFGRGLKETILALGVGHIHTVKDGILSETKIWVNEKGEPIYDNELLSNTKYVNEPDGTEIKIEIKNEKMRIPDYETLKKRLSLHYALRDINSSSNREIKLIFEDLKRKSRNEVIIKFNPPSGKKVFDKDIELPYYGDKFKVTIFESYGKLDSPRNNPYGLAGILIKTKSATLDNQLFRFENDSAAFYFFGEAVSSDMENRIRKGEDDIVNLNRGGLEWKHQYCKTLSETLETILEPLVLEKKKEMEKKPPQKMKKKTIKILRNVCNLLNEFAKQENDELSGKVPTKEEFEVSALLIKPVVANVPAKSVRLFSIYAPKDLISMYGKRVYISSENPYIRPFVSYVDLEKHPKYPNLIWYKPFKVATEDREGEIGEITAKIGNVMASSRVKIAPFLKKSKSRRISGRKSGFISEIVPDGDPDPSQRVVYKDGRIVIYVNFPSVSRFIGGGLNGIETPEGKILLSELIGEAFCRQLAIKGLENGKYVTIPGSEIDSYNVAVNELKKKYLAKIQEAILNST